MQMAAHQPDGALVPGMFGVVGLSADVHQRAGDAFATAFAGTKIEKGTIATIGAHAHSPAVALSRSPTRIVAVDGEVSIYAAVATAAANRPASSHPRDAGPALRGNVALWDEIEDRLSITTECTGSFPVYYAHFPGQGLLFSNRMNVLARATSQEVDPLGCLQFLREASFGADRSLWFGIKRLQPGQSLEYDARSHALRIAEHSTLWSTMATETTVEDVVEEAWPRLCRSVDRAPTSMMMSGGWDSRTLLAITTAMLPPRDLLAYSHGDVLSRELRIAEKLAAAVGVSFQAEGIDDSCYDPATLKKGFDREEHVVFPHWHRAGQIAAAASHVVAAGVYGEILGGHYGRAMLLQGSGKIRAVMLPLMGLDAGSVHITEAAFQSVRDFLSMRSLVRPWPVRQDWWTSAGLEVDALNADVDHDLNRLRARGIATLDQLIEAYVSEHRGSQYINAQVRSARAWTNVSMPFADAHVLELVTPLPLPLKIHNRLSRQLLRRFAPSLVRLPMAATLAQARRPILIQEASRIARRLAEHARWRAHSAFRGRVRAPHFSWVNFEFLRQGSALTSIIDDLRAPLWDKPAMLARVREIQHNRSVPTHPLSDQMMKVYTIDLALRCS